jgi:hypothetical protein
MNQPTLDADRLADQVARDLPPAATWTMPPRGYRQALALCVVDGVTRPLLGTRTDEVIGTLRAKVGSDADHADLDVLVAALADPTATWIPVVADAPDAASIRQALEQAVEVLTQAGIISATALVERLKAEGLNGPTGQRWQHQAALTRRMWTDTAMLAGYLDPEVDRIIAAYVSRAMGADPATTPPERVIAALTEVAARNQAKILPLEFAILEHERAD